MTTAETASNVGTVDLLLWVVFPYVCLAVFAVGHFWRYRYDKFGWTTRSSQLYESRLLRLGSPLFHFGLLFVILGHVMGLGVPKSWTEKVGISEGMYHASAVGVGSVAGFCTLVGMTILIYRRRTVGPVFSATTRMDKAMYAVLGTVIVLGLVNTVVANVFGHYDYRDGVHLVPRHLPARRPGAGVGHPTLRRRQVGVVPARCDRACRPTADADTSPRRRHPGESAGRVLAPRAPFRPRGAAQSCAADRGAAAPPVRCDGPQAGLAVRRVRP